MECVMELNLSNKRVLVTGGARGIGEGIAHQFAAEGAEVIIADQDETRAQRTLETLKEAAFVRMDVTDEGSVQSAVERIGRDFGQIDILINNAGVSNRVKLVDMSFENLDTVFKVNMYGTFLVTRAVIPQMIERKHGKIVNIAAMVGTSPMPAYAHYSASKAAVIAFTNAIAKEHAEFNLNINCISPGAVNTRLWSQDYVQVADKLNPQHVFEDIEMGFALGRAQKIEDIANMACYLSSDLAQNITGQNFFVTS